MNAQLAQQLAWLSPQASVLKNMRRGLEKESLRMTPTGHLTQSRHPDGLGAALTHPYITTDYSEALIELITPATKSIDETLTFLEDLHSYTYQHLGDERLWLNSMPCMIGLEDESIPLAYYGESNIGKLKTLYRHGLGIRYGRKMQTIAGIHYNLSFPPEFWQAWQTASETSGELQDFINEQYFGLIRNFQRHSYLLLYLLGASPAVCACFLLGRDHNLASLGTGTLYQPYATSLRMSRLGYQNTVQRDLQVSYNHLPDYIRDLSHAIHTPYPPFAELGVKKDGVYQQMNTNVLQIENEYYGLIRPKQTIQRGEKPTQALKSRGIEYIEMRCVDLNPFTPTGIDSPTAHFLEVFALHSLLSDSPHFEAAEYAELAVRQEQMVEQGRKPDLHIDMNGADADFKNSALSLMAEMQRVALVLDEAHNTTRYSASIDAQIAKIEHPEQTYAAQVLVEMEKHQNNFFAFGHSIAEQHRDYFLSRPLSAERQDFFNQEAQASHAAQKAIEDSDTLSFDDFLAAYIA
ncbi:MAG: glutamate--cysteine ligase [Agitococcus sp.]|nr:glutamate--cysteine ligase [Agitococcus sp.]MDO9178796.1 glutamate--cysteine ligase [Agitococcus sp.]